MKITVMGCGNSMGVPEAGNVWGICDPTEPRNRRTRASILVQSATTNIIVDTAYEFREQVNACNVTHLDGVFISHIHSDHISGLDDLRPYARINGKKVNAYTNQDTAEQIEKRFDYMFKDGVIADYQPIKMNVIPDAGTVRIGDIDVTTFLQDHKSCHSLGFRFGNIAYCPDMMGLPEESLKALAGIKTWIVDAAGYHNEKPNNHAVLRQVMEWNDILKPEMTYLTVLDKKMDYKTLCDELPPHIRPAYDGLVIEAE